MYREIEALFVSGCTARAAARSSGRHLATVRKVYDRLRRERALASEERYRAHADRVGCFDEFLYLPATLSIEAHAEKIRHILVLAYTMHSGEEQIYTIELPSLLDQGWESDEAYRQLQRYRFHRVARLKSDDDTPERFWHYFVHFIRRFHGVNDVNFGNYLKEAEWRFNTGTWIREGCAGCRR